MGNLDNVNKDGRQRVRPGVKIAAGLMGLASAGLLAHALNKSEHSVSPEVPAEPIPVRDTIHLVPTPISEGIHDSVLEIVEPREGSDPEPTITPAPRTDAEVITPESVDSRAYGTEVRLLEILASGDDEAMLDYLYSEDATWIFGFMNYRCTDRSLIQWFLDHEEGRGSIVANPNLTTADIDFLAEWILSNPDWRTTESSPLKLGILLAHENVSPDLVREALDATFNGMDGQMVGYGEMYAIFNVIEKALRGPAISGPTIRRIYTFLQSLVPADNTVVSMISQLLQYVATYVNLPESLIPDIYRNTDDLSLKLVLIQRPDIRLSYLEFLLEHESEQILLNYIRREIEAGTHR